MNVDLTLLRLLDVTLLGLAVWALIDAATRRAEAFPAAGRLTKPIWLAILAASVASGLLFGAFSLLGAAAAVGCIVYLGDVRPAVRESGGYRG